jgi:hypothetical protein
MSTLISLSIDVTKITKSKIKDGKYLDVTISVDDQTNQWGKNASIYESQTKEERDSKASKSYIGGGKVVWTTGTLQWLRRALMRPRKLQSHHKKSCPSKR